MLRTLINEIHYLSARWAPRYRWRPYRENTAGNNLPAQDLLSATDLSGLSETSCRVALLYAWILEHVPWQGQGHTRRAVDIGSKDFVYATALHAYLRQRNHAETELCGIEPEAYRIYWNLYRRGDHARYYAACVNQSQGAQRVDYQVADWLSWHPEQSYDLITCFFPFLYADLSDAWGLPRRFFQPQRLYTKAMQQAPSVLLFHQGPEETQDSLRLIDQIGGGVVTYAEVFQENPWIERKHPIHVLLWTRFRRENAGGRAENAG